MKMEIEMEMTSEIGIEIGKLLYDINKSQLFSWQEFSASSHLFIAFVKFITQIRKCISSILCINA